MTYSHFCEKLTISLNETLVKSTNQQGKEPIFYVYTNLEIKKMKTLYTEKTNINNCKCNDTNINALNLASITKVNE